MAVMNSIYAHAKLPASISICAQSSSKMDSSYLFVQSCSLCEREQRIGNVTMCGMATGILSRLELMRK